MDESIYQLSEFFKILSDQTRLKILIALSKKECSVSELQEFLNTTQSTVSHQLRILRQTNLVKYSKVGRRVYYKLYDEHVKTIINFALEHLEEFRGGSKNA
ncbi:ArsR family transcriptional regulator [Thermosipho africanus H17ap60334]|jgi:DNA-binding transcriptional ArsR family regulator|uniref:Transcriptional regulator, ArsR family n=1 Tax=Thermosipho africanus (strain TCF52B) TaxID=484019 RepID=B7IDA8_THEAB|nr:MULTISPECIES: metalloregulator ArsR/SmtB family transcription factor [Thermosipho]ACJ75985.1 transcriptional regulator, ArsR family [Thermosipho africanus TCF52B]EKF49547.1 ArsR family transcriptional regulator [Thermosipho africanus H17ap60334]MBZ4650305.1 transcriptional regulator, ArsR family [Thermosipho sp. (in: thermotogales)]MDK2840378.1 ArsR family transcriptional regulator, lead/cadmium/zinc/bismuth-responsive transcriptional [Thermosipho sp. (in: thermotogales)]MDK2900017.1 ArsR f